MIVQSDRTGFCRILCIAGLCYASVSQSAEHCSVTATPMTFPPYDIYESVPVHSQAELSISCDQNILFAVKMSAGINALGDFSRRQMSSSETSSPLFYNLFLDSSYARIWGDGTGFSEFYSGTGTGRPEMLRVYGRIPPSQMVGVGAYSDSIVITIEW